MPITRNGFDWMLRYDECIGLPRISTRLGSLAWRSQFSHT